jgi:hypothetical protein
MTNFYNSASFLLVASAYSSSKVYAIKPTDGSGDISFIPRGTLGFRTNSSSLIEQVGSNIIRLDYSLDSCPSFLFETQRTNLLIQSNGFSTTWTLQQATVTSSQAISPDGTNNAWKLNETTANSTHDVRQNPVSGYTFVSGSRYIISAYVKPAERTRVAIQSNIGGGFDYTRFNLTGTGSIQDAPAGHTASISLLTNGWYRISDAITSNATSTRFLSISLLSGSTNNNETYSGSSATSGLYIYGAQIELASYTTSTIPTSYIPTTTATVTRNGDYPLGIPTSSDPYNFTILHVGTFEANEANAGPSIQITSGSTYIGFYGTTGRASWTGGGVVGSNVSTGSEHKMLIKFQNNSTASWFVDGVKIHSQSISISNPSWDYLALNNYSPFISSSNEAPTEYRIVTVIPSALSDADCITLTT